MVVGAGRGPLVRRALAAAKAAKRMIKVYAVEKNPNAVVTLQAQQDEDWGDQVLVLATVYLGYPVIFGVSMIAIMDVYRVPGEGRMSVCTLPLPFVG